MAAAIRLGLLTILASVTHAGKIRWCDPEQSVRIFHLCKGDVVVCNDGTPEASGTWNVTKQNYCNGILRQTTREVERGGRNRWGLPCWFQEYQFDFACRRNIRQDREDHGTQKNGLCFQETLQRDTHLQPKTLPGRTKIKIEVSDTKADQNMFLQTHNLLYSPESVVCYPSTSATKGIGSTHKMLLLRMGETGEDLPMLEDDYTESDGLVTVMSLLSFIVNLLAIVILCRGKCGLSKCITRYLVAMAVSDLLVGITDPFLRQTIPIYFPYSFLNITPVCTTVLFLVFATTAVSVWLTVAFTFDRFVAICCEKLKIKYCTERTAAVVIGAVIVLGCLENIPSCFTIDPGYEFDNLPWLCYTKPTYYTSSAWIAYDVTHRVLTPCLPFFLILLLNVLTVRRIVADSRVRRGLRGRSNGENDKDPEMENRRKSIVLFFSITGTFVLLWAPQAVFVIFAGIAKIGYDLSPTGYYYITIVASGFLQLLSTCTNTCIYVVTQSKFRQELMNAVKFPLRAIRALVRS
ncbi:uncharacterized protein LOC144591849 [Rhinoraja longicauda]